MSLNDFFYELDKAKETEPSSSQETRDGDIQLTNAGTRIANLKEGEVWPPVDYVEASYPKLLPQEVPDGIPKTLFIYDEYNPDVTEDDLKKLLALMEGPIVCLPSGFTVSEFLEQPQGQDGGWGAKPKPTPLDDFRRMKMLNIQGDLGWEASQLEFYDQPIIVKE